MANKKPVVDVVGRIARERCPKLIAAAMRLGPNALAVLEEIAQRLTDNTHHADLASGPGRETYEEMVDRVVHQIGERERARAGAFRVIDGGGRRSRRRRTLLRVVATVETRIR